MFVCQAKGAKKRVNSIRMRCRNGDERLRRNDEMCSQGAPEALENYTIWMKFAIVTYWNEQNENINKQFDLMNHFFGEELKNKTAVHFKWFYLPTIKFPLKVREKKGDKYRNVNSVKMLSQQWKREKNP